MYQKMSYLARKLTKKGCLKTEEIFTSLAGNELVLAVRIHTNML